MFDAAPWKRNCSIAAQSPHRAGIVEFVKLRLAKLEAEQQRGIPFNEAIGNDYLGLDSWRAACCRLARHDVQSIRPHCRKILQPPKRRYKNPSVPPIGEPLAAKRGAKVNLTN